MTLDYGPPNPRPKPKERPTVETKYMNSRLRDDKNFWWGVVTGWLLCGASVLTALAVLSLFV